MMTPLFRGCRHPSAGARVRGRAVQLGLALVRGGCGLAREARCRLADPARWSVNRGMTNADLQALFLGMALHDPAAVRDAANFDGWRDAARRILDQRRARLLEALPDDALRAIASGAVDPRSAAAAALLER